MALLFEHSSQVALSCSNKSATRLPESEDCVACNYRSGASGICNSRQICCGGFRTGERYLWRVFENPRNKIADSPMEGTSESSASERGRKGVEGRSAARRRLSFLVTRQIKSTSQQSHWKHSQL